MVDGAQVGDLVNKHIYEFLVIDVIGIVGDLGLGSKNDIVSLGWVG